MKITKTQLKNLIKEELSRVDEMYQSQVESGSELIEFAKAFSSLGSAVQEQVSQLISAYYHLGEESEGFAETVYELNPNAIELAFQRMSPALRKLEDQESDDLLEALERAKYIYMAGHDEVDSDRAAAEEEL
jgi:hypothetical protein